MGCGLGSEIVPSIVLAFIFVLRVDEFDPIAVDTHDSRVRFSSRKFFFCFAFYLAFPLHSSDPGRSFDCCAVCDPDAVGQNCSGFKGAVLAHNSFVCNNGLLDDRSISNDGVMPNVGTHNHNVSSNDAPFSNHTAGYRASIPNATLWSQNRVLADIASVGEEYVLVFVQPIPLL